MALRGKRILVVEDESLLAADYAAALTLAGAAVLGPASDCTSALQILNRHGADAVVLDIKLDGGEDSYSVAEHLHDRRIPYVFVSSYEHAGVKKGFSKRPFLAKPFTHAQLVAAVEVLVS